MKYFKATTASLDGAEGDFLVETKNGVIVRQIRIFDGVIYWATPEAEKDGHYPLTDQPETKPSEYDSEIDKAEFERVWIAGGGPLVENVSTLIPGISMLEPLQGDLLDLAEQGVFDVIVHGCNCLCVMGAGIAKAVKARYPEAYEADQATKKGDRGKLGTITSATVRRDGRSFVVVNAYTQFDYRGPDPKLDYDALRACFRRIKKELSGRRIGYPKIGAGLAGGDWDRIVTIIQEELAGEDHRLVERGADTDKNLYE